MVTPKAAVALPSADVVLGAVGVERDFGSVEHAQKITLALEEPFEQAIERSETGFSREDPFESGPELGGALSRGLLFVELEVPIEPPD